MLRCEKRFILVQKTKDRRPRKEELRRARFTSLRTEPEAVFVRCVVIFIRADEVAKGSRLYVVSVRFSGSIGFSATTQPSPLTDVCPACHLSAHPTATVKSRWKRESRRKCEPPPRQQPQPPTQNKIHDHDENIEWAKPSHQSKNKLETRARGATRRARLSRPFLCRPSNPPSKEAEHGKNQQLKHATTTITLQQQLQSRSLLRRTYRRTRRRS